jgi:hypothetical protein
MSALGDRLELAPAMRQAQDAIRRLGQLRAAMTHEERLQIAEVLRDVADLVDHGAAVGPAIMRRYRPLLFEPRGDDTGRSRQS